MTAHPAYETYGLAVLVITCHISPAADVLHGMACAVQRAVERRAELRSIIIVVGTPLTAYRGIVWALAELAVAAFCSTHVHIAHQCYGLALHVVYASPVVIRLGIRTYDLAMLLVQFAVDDGRKPRQLSRCIYLILRIFFVSVVPPDVHCAVPCAVYMLFLSQCQIQRNVRARHREGILYHTFIGVFDPFALCGRTVRCHILCLLSLVGRRHILHLESDFCPFLSSIRGFYMHFSCAGHGSRYLSCFDGIRYLRTGISCLLCSLLFLLPVSSLGFQFRLLRRCTVICLYILCIAAHR